MFSSLFLVYVWSTEDTKCSYQRQVRLVIIPGLWRRGARREEDKDHKETGEEGKDEELEEEKRKAGEGPQRRKKKRKRSKGPLCPGNLCISHLVSLMKLAMQIPREPLAQKGSTAPSLDVKEPVDYTLPDVFSLHTIDNGVEHRWHHHIKIGQQDMDMSRNVTSKAVGQ